MVESVKRHLSELAKLRMAGIPFSFLKRKGEESCTRAAEKILKNEVTDMIPFLREETLLHMIEDVKVIDYFGNLRKEEQNLNLERFQQILLNAGTDKLSDIAYEQVEKIYFDQVVTADTAYHYMKYYGKLKINKKEKEQLVKSLATCIGTMDFDEAGEKGRMLLIQPVFSSDLLLGLLGNRKNIESLQNQELMELVNTLAGYEAETDALNQKQFDQMTEKPVEILEKLRTVTMYIPKELLPDGLNLWLWNESLYPDLCKLEKALVNGGNPSIIFASKVSYVNMLYRNPLSGMDLSRMSSKKMEILLYAITQKKKNFLQLISKEKTLFYDIPDTSLLLNEAVYQEYLNLNTINQKNLKESAYLCLPRGYFENLAKREYTFEELKLLCTASKFEIRLYEQLSCTRSDEKLRAFREIIKRECMPPRVQEGQIELLAKALSVKPLSRWIQEDFKNIQGLSYGTAIWLLIYQEQLKGMEKEITMEQQVFFLLKDLELIKECASFGELKEKLVVQDVSWKVLCKEFSFSEEFIQENAKRIGEFILAGGAEIMAVFLKEQPAKKEEIRRLVTAELLGKFQELKYPAGDLMREIDFDVSEEAENEWKKDLTCTSGNLVANEETSLLPVMQIGEIPTQSCISYRTGCNSECLLSCFDSNKKFLFIKKNGQVVFRAMLRLTKGSFADNRKRKGIEFADLLKTDEKNIEEGEELVLFLERYYEKKLSVEELDAAVNLAITAAKEKARKLGARFVLSTRYQDDVKRNEYVKSNYYLYISKSKNGSQYLDSLYGEASVMDSGDYSCNTFLMENEAKEKDE